MKRNTLTIYDNEGSYAEKLSEQISMMPENIFEVHTFNRFERLAEFADGQHSDILLVSENLFVPELTKLNIEKTIILDEGSVKNHPDGIIIFPKYRPASELIKFIMELWSLDSDEHLRSSSDVDNDSPKILGFFSTENESFKSLFALAMGIFISEHSPCLYINLNVFPGISTFYTDPYYEPPSKSSNIREKLSSDSYNIKPTAQRSKTLADLLYFIDSRSSNQLCMLNSMLKKIETLDVIPPMPEPQDVLETHADEYLKLIELIKTNDTYKYLLIDFGCSIDHFSLLLEKCHRIYYPVSKNTFSQLRLSEFKRYESHNLSFSIREITIPEEIILPDGNAFIKHLIFGSFGQYVKSIAQKDMLI